MPKIRFELKPYLARLRLDKKPNIPTQRELARLLNVSETHFSRMVNQSTDSITYEQLALLIAALRRVDPACDVGDLLRFVE